MPRGTPLTGRYCQTHFRLSTFLLAKLLQRLSKRQSVAIRVEHVEIAFPQDASRGISGFNPLSFRYIQNVSTSATWKIRRPHRDTLAPCSRLRIADSESFVRSEEKPRMFSAVKQIQAEHISVKLHRSLHVQNPKSNRRNLFNRRRHTPASVPRLCLSGGHTVKVEPDPGTGLESSIAIQRLGRSVCPIMRSSATPARKLS